MNEQFVLLLMVGVVVAVGLFLLLKPASEPIEFKEWDASAIVKLEPIRIPTRAKGLNVFFKSHVDDWTVTSLSRVEIGTPASSLKGVFVSHTDKVFITRAFSFPALSLTATDITRVFCAHVDNISSANLVPPSINTVVEQNKSIFLSHVDAFVFVSLIMPEK